MDEQFLLSDLCSICHAQVPKYRCPRCSTRTCSLPCVKLHKARAPCIGLRDPTGYVKKSHLATSSGIDHDFNFIRGVERGIEKAEKGIGIKGLNQEEKWLKNAVPLKARMREVGVRVERAPTGMQREQQNKTHWARKARHILWTVEWVDEDGSRHLDEFSEHTTIEQAHLWLLRRLKSKRKPDSGLNNERERGGRRGKKAREAAAAKREQVEVIDEPGALATDLETPEIHDADLKAAEVLGRDTTKSNEDLEVKDETTIELSPGTTTNSGGTNGNTSHADPSGESPDLPDVASSGPMQETPTPRYFYLVKPRTGGSSRRCVLIPLSNDTTLGKCLKGQIVLEFPTIQVLLHPPSQLPERFVTEEQYNAMSAAEDEELRKEVREAEMEGLNGSTGPVQQGATEHKEDRMPNQSDLLAILQRDILG